MYLLCTVLKVNWLTGKTLAIISLSSLSLFTFVNDVSNQPWSTEGESSRDSNIKRMIWHQPLSLLLNDPTLAWCSWQVKHCSCHEEFRTNISVCSLRNSQAKLQSAAYIISREVVVSLGFWSDILFSFVIYQTFTFEVNRKLSFYKKVPLVRGIFPIIDYRGSSAR